jgi:hypothetical protein
MDDIPNLSLGYLDGLRKDMSSARFMEEYIEPMLEYSPLVQGYPRAPFLCAMVFTAGYYRPTVVTWVVLDTATNTIVESDDRVLSMYLVELKAQKEKMLEELRMRFPGVEIIME